MITRFLSPRAWLLAFALFATVPACMAAVVPWQAIAPPDMDYGAAVALDDGQGGLYIAGQFYRTPGGPVTSVAHWDGGRWRAVGTGVIGRVQALALDPDTGTLYAGGFFNLDAGGSNLARFREGAWEAVGGGVPHPVSALAWDRKRGRLYVGVDYPGRQDGGTRPLHAWDGSQWLVMPVFTGKSTLVPEVDALVLDDAGDTLYVGGEFLAIDGVAMPALARFDGAQWSPVGAGLAHGQSARLGVRALALDPRDRSLVAGGVFEQAGQAAAANIARWDGAEWRPVGAGLDEAVLDLAVSPSGVIHAGYGPSATDASRSRLLASYADGAWAPVPASSLLLRGIAAYGPCMIAMGTLEAAGTAYPIACWDGSAWSDVGARTSLWADAIAWDEDGSLVAGGLDVVDGVSVRGIARWDGAQWSELGGGVAGGTVVVMRRDPVGGGLVVAGSFTQAGGQAMSRIARWKDGTWSPLGAGLPGLTVSALAQVPGTAVLYAAVQAEDSLWSVYRWDGVAWTALPGRFNRSLRSLAVEPGGAAVYAGGTFTSRDGVAATSVARWDGTAWTSIGLPGQAVLALHWEPATQRLWAGTVSAVASWDGTGWQDVGAGSPKSAEVLVPLDQGGMIAAGAVESGGLAAPGAKRWDGQTWQPLGAGLGGTGGPVARAQAGALSDDGTRFALAGNVAMIGGLPASIAIARLDGDENAAPAFTGAPSILGEGRVGALLEAVADAIDDNGDVVSLRYQWRRDGRPITGATGREYRVAPGDEGRRLAVSVTASDGKDVVSATSAPLRVRMTSNAPPVFTATPMITGDAFAGGILGLTGIGANDPDGDPVNVTVSWRASSSELSRGTGMTFVVPPFSRGLRFYAVVTLSDGVAEVSRSTPDVVIGNAAPIALADNVLTTLRPRVVFSRLLLANDGDPDGDALVASLLVAPARGVAEVRADGTLVLSDLPVDEPYSDRLGYTACDSRGACANGTVYLEFEAGLLGPIDTVLDVDSDFFAVDVPIDAVDSSGRAVASVVDLRRVQQAPASGRVVESAPGVQVVSLHPNLADVPVAYAIEFRAHTGPGGNGSVRVHATSPGAPALACAGDAGRTSRCLVDVELPPRSPGLVFHVEAEQVVLNADEAIVPIVDYVVHDLDDVGLHGGVAAIAPKQVDAGTPVQVRLVGDVPGVRHEPTVIEGRVELRDGPGGALLGERTFRVTPRGLRPAARVVTPGRPAFVPLSRQQVYYGNIQHQRLRVPVPVGTYRVMVTVDGPVGAAYLVEGPRRNLPDVPSREQSVPDFATGGLRLPLERDAQGRLVEEIVGITREGRTWTLELWGGLPAGVTPPAGSAPATARVEVQYEVGTPPYSVQPGHYFNPGRDGHGVFVERGGTQMVAWWYAYEADGAPTWYMAQADAPAPGVPFAADAYRVTWSLEGGATLHDVGQVVLTPEYGGTLGFSYEVDGATGQERLVSLSEGGCLPVDGVSVDGAGSWFSPERPGFGYSVMWDARTSQEIMITYAYDADGLPRWGYAQAPASTDAVAELPIVQLSGFAPDAAWRPLVNLGQIGTLRRTIGLMPQDGQPGLRRASVAMAFTGPVTGAFVQDLETALLTNRRACR